MADSIKKLIHDALEASVKEATRATYKRALVLSSGTRTLAQLAQMDHPFARRNPIALLDPGIINMQTGAFKRDWKSSFSGMSGEVSNSNFVVPFLTEGTKFMHVRPIDKAVEDYARFALEKAVKRNLTKI